MKEDREIDKIIKYAPERMKSMLASVYNYNSGFDNGFLEKVLFALTIIDRKFFVENETFAYDDNALPIGSGQTISQPSTVVRMLLLAEIEQGDDVLEIGSGSGWNASLISFLVYPGRVMSVDRIQNLVEKAQENLNRLRNHLKQKHPQDFQKLSKLDFIAEDAFAKKKVWKKKYDKIIITAGIANKETEKRIEEMAKALLKQNGILICPYTAGPLIMYKKNKNKELVRKETGEEYVFVPLLEGLEK